MAKYRDTKTPQKFAADHASIHNRFDQGRYLNRRDICKQNRSAAPAEWRQLAARMRGYLPFGDGFALA